MDLPPDGVSSSSNVPGQPHLGHAKSLSRLDQPISNPKLRKLNLGAAKDPRALNSSSSSVMDGPRKSPLPQSSSLYPVVSLDRALRAETQRVALKKRSNKLKSRPPFDRRQSGGTKIVFSVDDAITDTIEVDPPGPVHSKTDRDYLQGYMAALRSLQQNIDSKQPTKVTSQRDLRPVLALTHLAQLEASEPESSSSVKCLRGNGPLLPSESHLGSGEVDESRDPAYALVHENDDARSLSSDYTAHSLESLNLRERQDAINETHPFGIKIWKPSLYKKSRSVAARAVEDIHDFKAHAPTAHKYWGITLTNTIWSLTFGLFLCSLCWLGAAILFVFSGLAIHRASRPYVSLLIALGKYFLYPFGKFVLLNKDKNYMLEDALYGRLISEFHQWRLQEEGRLFFAPPRRNTGHNETRPLLKDQHGRFLGEAYSSIETEEQVQSPDQSQASIAATPLPDSSGIADDDDDDNDDDDDTEDNPQELKKRFFGRGSWSSGRFVFYVFFYAVLQPALSFTSLVCWLGVFTIPMTNICSSMGGHLRRHPLALAFEFERDYYRANAQHQPKRKHQLILLCTYRCCGRHYYKYTIDGTNIFFVNLLAAVVFVIFDYFVLKEKLGWDTWYTNSIFMFAACLFSIIPLAYFIGQAVASISAQSSMGVGAVINAFFSTIVEIFLYCVALSQSKAKLVEGSMIGSILGGVLLLPGLSMCGGAINRKTQRYNPRSAGVSSTMLNYAMVVMFAPSAVNQIYGAYEMKCKKCDDVAALVKDSGCNRCRFSQPDFALDSVYYEVIKPFSAIIAVALFAAYVCGLYFTLKTHASLIWATNSHEAQANKAYESALVLPMPGDPATDLIAQPVDDAPRPNTDDRPRSSPLATEPSATHGSAGSAHIASTNPPTESTPQSTPATNPLLEPAQVAFQDSEHARNHHPDHRETDEHNGESGGHDAPNWSRNKSTVILLGATLMYAVIAEILVDNVDAVLSRFPMEPKFLGLTIFALVPNTTEFLNAISFAINGNVALSMEIGSAYALQVVLIQIPSLVLYSIYKNYDRVDMLFPLVFPRWDVIATFTSIFLFTYIYAEGKSNYFKGVILILIYTVVLIGFWFNDKIALMEDGYVSSAAYFSALAAK